LITIDYQAGRKFNSLIGESQKGWKTMPEKIGNTERTNNEVRPGRREQDTPPMPMTEIYRNVSIRKVANGFIVEVGCRTFVFREWAEVAAALAEYWIDPVAAEKKYCK